ncbi:MAG: ferritin [Victivallaceae bacterium]|jgi:ferritin
MLSKAMEKALNDQLNFEIYSSYLYMSMVSALEAMNYKGAAHWMRIQAMEELFHANKFFNYIIDREGRAILQEIKKPKTDWKSFLEIFEDAHKHEKIVTSRICNLVDLALTEKDHVTNSTLQWFVTEQIEEESNGKTIIEKIKRTKNSTDGLMMIDTELGARVLSPLANVTAAISTPA